MSLTPDAFLAATRAQASDASVQAALSQASTTPQHYHKQKLQGFKVHASIADWIKQALHALASADNESHATNRRRTSAERKQE